MQPAGGAPPHARSEAKLPDRIGAVTPKTSFVNGAVSPPLQSVALYLIAHGDSSCLFDLQALVPLENEACEQRPAAAAAAMPEAHSPNLLEVPTMQNWFAPTSPCYSLNLICCAVSRLLDRVTRVRRIC